MDVWRIKHLLWYSSSSIEQFYGNFREKGFKLASKIEVLDLIIAKFEEGLENVQFKEKENLKAKKNEIELVLEAKPFQIKYNNLKQQWRKINDKKKTSSRLAFTEDPEWFKVIKPILIDTNKGLDSVYCEIADT